MTSLVVIGNLKNSLEASIHKHSKHNKEKGNITLDKNPRIHNFHSILAWHKHNPKG
jgi:hypothetical protein